MVRVGYQKSHNRSLELAAYSSLQYSNVHHTIKLFAVLRMQCYIFGNVMQILAAALTIVVMKNNCHECMPLTD